VHTALVHLAPILGAEKAKTPFYIAGGLLVAWALIVSLGLGMRNPNFPGTLGGQRVVAAITAVLVVAAASTAVITSGSPEATGRSSSLASESSAEEAKNAAGPPSTSSPGSSPVKEDSSAKTGTGPTSGKPGSGKSPKATTGTPAPPSSPAATATTLKLAANASGQLAFETKALQAKAGKVTIDFTNESPVEHDVAIALGSAVAGQTPVFTGGSKTLTVTLKPGKYTFYCTVPGHRQAGMEGTLNVS
jgi:plastocyanin